MTGFDTYDSLFLENFHDTLFLCNRNFMSNIHVKKGLAYIDDIFKNN